MPLFVCDKCDVIDNTACGGTYWTKDSDIWPDDIRGLALCAECTPTTYSDGSPNKEGGKWHGRWQKKFMTQEIATERPGDFWYLGRFERFRK